MSRIRTLVADGDSTSRRRLARFLASDPEIELVETCADGRTAADALARLTPELVVVDVQLPDMTSFDVLAAAPAPPIAMFVTACDRHAIQAFECHAVEYVLKPFSRARFIRALAFAKERVRQRNAAELCRSLLERYTGEQRPRRILIRTDGRLKVIPVSEIVWIQAQGSAVTVYTLNGAFPVRDSLGGFEKRLDPATFIRIQRSIIVNVEHVTDLVSLPHGENLVVLTGGDGVRTNRTCDLALRHALAGTRGLNGDSRAPIQLSGGEPLENPAG